jgi:hypothetical protein
LTRTTATRLAVLVALGGVAALGGTATSGVGSFASAETPVPSDAASGTASDGSTDVTTSVSFAVDLHSRMPTQGNVHLSVQGQMDFVHHTLTATVTVPTSALPATASNTGTRSVASTITLHTEWVNDVAYMSVPSTWAALAHGAHTLSLPTSSSLRRTVTTALTQSAVAVTYAKLLLDELTVHESAHHFGSRMIGGVSATGTGVELTLTQLLKLVPELSPTMTKVAARMADEKIPATVWVDHHGRLVEVSLPQSSSDDDQASSVIGTMRFSHYGAPVAVTVPPAATVKPIPHALRQMLGGWYYF